MRLRTILLVLSLLAFLSASVGGSLYYNALHSAAVKEAERQAVSRLVLIKKNLSAFLSEFIKPVESLAGINALYEVLNSPQDRRALKAANAVLDHFKRSLDVQVCYLMDYQGNTIASSNRDASDSFVGKNFAFRPYFTQAFHSAPATYMAVGTTSGKRGVYFSYPVFDRQKESPIGLAVIKAPIDQIEKELKLFPEEVVLVISPEGVIFLTNRDEWRYKTLTPLNSKESEQIATTRQFGGGPWAWSGLKMLDQTHIESQEGVTYLHHIDDLPDYADWKIHHLQNLAVIEQRIYSPLLNTVGPIILSLCCLIGLAVAVLYRKASQEITRRQLAEKALRQSEERYRSLYHDTPAMLHSIDANGHLLSVSDYWLEAMGYSRDEVIGQQLTQYFTLESKAYAETTVFPAFFKDGFCKDVPYRYTRKDGTIIDILLSGNAVRGEDGQIVRSLAVSVNVTELKQAEAALRQAKEQLSLYSKDLERQVRRRTREISNILKYTPDVVYMKDKEGRYILINTRYEKILGRTVDEVKGKTDHELLPREVADQFRANDLRILKGKHSLQVEEHFPHEDGLHTYLSVKFPFYNEAGEALGVGGISTDITALKKAQDQLRRLSAKIMEGQEKERSAIARELHDELGQVLTALRMDAVWMAEHLKSADPDAAKRSKTMCQLIDQNIQDVRNMAIRLRPGVLDDLGLVDALEWLTADFEKRTGISVVFDHGAIPVLSGTIATAAYRIVQEALTNIGRHAEAGHVTVTLQVQEKHLSLKVEDDGNGFDTAALSDLEALGVAGMRERASLVGGELMVTSAVGKGTEVVLTVPVKDDYGVAA